MPENTPETDDLGPVALLLGELLKAAKSDVPHVEKLAFSVEEAAWSLGTSKVHCQKLINEGVIPSIPLGKSKRVVPVALLKEVLEERSKTARRKAS